MSQQLMKPPTLMIFGDRCVIKQRDFITTVSPKDLQIRFFNYLCSLKCGEIWLLATTLKNAKILT